MRNAYDIPGASGIQRVYADAGNVSPQVAAAVAEFNSEFKKFKAKYGDQADALADKVTEVAANLLEIEQKLADRLGTASMGGATRHDPAAALAAYLTKDAAFGDVMSGRNKAGTSIEVDAGMFLGNVQASTTKTDDGGLAVRQNVGVAGVVERKRFVRQRLSTLPALGGSIEFSRESWTNNADEQGAGSPFIHEGVQKAETDISFDLLDEKIPTIAHWCKASRQILQDVGGLQQFLSNRLLHGLELRLEQRILDGSGAGGQQKGLFHADNRVAFMPTSGDTAIDSISRALGIAANSNEIMPDLLLLNPLDYRAMQRTKAVDSGVYLWGGPGGADVQTCWEVPIHASPAVTQGNFAVTETGQMGFLAIRMDSRVELGLDGNDFTSNLATLLAEIRALLVVERPTATLYGSLVL